VKAGIGVDPESMVNSREHSFVHGGYSRRFVIVFLVALISACASNTPKPQEAPPDWTIDFDRPVAFQLLVRDDLLIVGTVRHLYGIDPATGKTLWRKRNVAITRDDLTPLGDRSYVLVNDAAGGAFDDRDTNILALDNNTGDILWESRILQGKILQGALDDSEEIFYFTTVPKAHGDDRGFLAGALPGKGFGSGYEQVPYLHALEVSTGRLLWNRAFEHEVLLRPAMSRQLDEKDDWTYTRPFDLGLYHPPFVAGNLVCLTYTGIYCYDRASGNLSWKRKFDVIEHDLALSYANPLVDNDTIITSGNRRVRAYDRRNGNVQWKSEKFDIVSELLLDGNTVYGQLGGQFFDIDSEKWKWKGDFGVVALDRRNGKTLWKYDDADDASTNLLIYDDKIWLADKKHLIALDRFDGHVRYRQEHGFEEPPVYAALNEMGQVVLVGDGEAAAFAPDLGTRDWYVQHAPIKPGAWSRFSTALMRATGNVLKFGTFLLSHGVGVLPSLAVPIGSVNFKIISTKKIVTTTAGRTARRLTYHSGFDEGGVGNLNLSGNFQYFVTQPHGSGKAALAMLNLSTGKTERMIRMDAEYPDLVIDEGNNKIYENIGQQLLALPLEHPSPSYALNRELPGAQRRADSIMGEPMSVRP